MSKKPMLLVVLLYSSFSLFAFHSPAASPVYGVSKQPQHFSDTGGRVVNLDSAQLCINRYAALMAAHGFTSQAGEKINLRIKKSDKITTGETFNGQKLLDWLSATNTAYMAAGKTLMVKVQLGVYDDNYLNTYQTDPALRAANKNRVAIFIVPYNGATGQSERALNVQPMGGTGGGGGGGGFDLGGVQP